MVGKMSDKKFCFADLCAVKKRLESGEFDQVIKDAKTQEQIYHEQKYISLKKDYGNDPNATASNRDAP